MWAGMGFVLPGIERCTNIAMQESLTLLVQPNIKPRLIKSAPPYPGRVMINIEGEPESSALRV